MRKPIGYTTRSISLHKWVLRIDTPPSTKTLLTRIDLIEGLFMYFIVTGLVGINLNSFWSEPEDESSLNIEAADRSLQFELGWFANPIFGDGNYPAIMIDQVQILITQSCFLLFSDFMMNRLAGRVWPKASASPVFRNLLKRRSGSSRAAPISLGSTFTQPV